MMHTLNDLHTAKSNGSQETAKAAIYCLNYCDSNPNPSKMYTASDMILSVYSNTVYLVTSKAQSRADGFIFLGNPNRLLVNSSIAVITKIIKNVMVSTAEAEFAALVLNVRFSIPLCLILIELGHPQPPTPIRTDNSTADGIANGIIKQKKTKAMDVRFCWLQNRQSQDQFKYYWGPGKTNLANYFTKNHSPAHHKRL